MPDVPLKKSNQLFVNNINESIQLSSLIYAPIFIPQGRGKGRDESRKKLKIDDLRRTKYEHVNYDGYELDLELDFKLYAVIISKAQMEGKSNITFTEKQLITIALNTKAATPLKLKIEDSLAAFQKSQLTIRKYNDKKEHIGTLITSIIKKAKWVPKEHIYYIEVDEEIINRRTDSYSKEKIYLDILLNLKGQHSKALFLYLETRKFNNIKNNTSGVNHNQEELYSRICPNYTKKDDKKKALKAALEQLQTIGYLNSFEEKKSEDVYEIPYWKVFMNHSYVKEQVKALKALKALKASK
jgi:hypothetical protein